MESIPKTCRGKGNALFFPDKIGWKEKKVTFAFCDQYS